MAISRINTPAVTVTAITPTSIAIGPSAVTTQPYGDLFVAVVGVKPSVANSATCSTPAGWTLAGSLTGAGGYGATLGADQGNTNLYFFVRRCENGVVQGTCTLTNTSVAWTQFWQLRSNTGLEWEDGVSASGQRTTIPTTPISITTTGNIALTAGDWVLGAFNIPTDITTPAQFSAHTLTATGATFAAVTEVTEPDSGTGTDIGGVTFQSSITSGSSSGTITWGAAITGTLDNVRGPMVIVRIREKATTRDRYYPIAVSGTVPSVGPTTEQSTVFPWGTDNTPAVTEDFFELSPTKPSASAGHSVVYTTLGQTARQSALLGYGWYRLGTQTIPAGTWAMAGFHNSNVSANNNANIGVSLYVWRPSTSSVVGYIYDTAAEVNGQEFGTVGNPVRFGAFSGSSISTTNGDLLVWEIWGTAAQGDTSVYTLTNLYTSSSLADAVLGSETNTTGSAWFEAPATLVAFTAGATPRSYGFIFD